MTQTIVNLGTGGAALNGQNGSTSGADSNDALFLDWDGENYVYLPGVASNYMSVPDEAALDITGDIDIRVQVAMDDWTSGSSYGLIAKFSDVGDNRGYMLRYFGSAGSGRLRFDYSTDGTGATYGGANSDASINLANGDVTWVRVTVDVNNGAGGADVKFYKSADAVSWTQIGSTQTIGSTISLYSSSANVNVGSFQDGAGNPAAGRFYRAQVFNGINGTKVLDVDTSVITSGSATSFNALTGQTVTINRSTSGRKSVAVVSPVWLFGTDDYMKVPYSNLLSFNTEEDFTAVAVIRFWDSYSAATGYFGTQNAWVNNPGWELDRAGATTSRALIGDGVTYKEASPRPTYTAGSLSVLGMQVNRTTGLLHGIDSNGLGNGVSIGSIGSLESLSNVSIGKTVHAGGSDVEIVAVAVFRRALTSTEITQISDYYQARLS
jgi:hypothetical protein